MSFCRWKRPSSPLEKLLLTTGTRIQIGIKLEDSKIMPIVIDEISKCVAGLHIAKCGDELWRINSPIIKWRLPNWISSVDDACEWTSKQNLAVSTRLANIAISDNIVVLNSDHACGDGGFFVQILNRVQSRLSGKEVQADADRIKSIDLLYADEMNQRNTAGPYSQSSCTTFTTKDRKVRGDTLTTAPMFRIPVHELSCYDPAKGKPSGLTEAIWTAMILTCHAYNKRIGVMKCGTCCNLRSPGIVDLERPCDFTIVAPEAHCKPTDTVAEMTRQMRRDLVHLLDSEHRLGFINTKQGQTEERLENRCAIEISHLGAVHFKRPIIDIGMHIAMQNMWTEDCISLLSFAKVNEEKNVFQGQLRCPPGKTDSVQADLLTRSVEHSLRFTKSEMTIQQAYEELARFQTSVMSNFQRCKIK